MLQSNGCQGGAGSGTWVLGVERQGIASTEHKGDALTDRNRLEKLDHVGVRSAEHADVVDVDNDIAWARGGAGRCVTQGWQTRMRVFSVLQEGVRQVGSVSQQVSAGQPSDRHRAETQETFARLMQDAATGSTNGVHELY